MSLLAALDLAAPAWIVASGAGLGAAAAWSLARRAGDGRARAAVRAALGSVLVLALATPIWASTAVPTVVVIDRSASVDGAQRRAFEAALPASAVRVAFGGDGTSDVGQALDSALPLLGGRPGRVVLASDGRATDDDAPEAAARLAEAGAMVDVLPLAPRVPVDAAVSALRIPARARAGDDLVAEVVLRATAAVTGELTATLDDRPILQRAVAVGGDGRAVAVPIPFRVPSVAGPLRLVADFAAGDAQPANDRLVAASIVAPPPRALIVGDGIGAVGLADSLAASGVLATVLGPSRMPPTRSGLEPYDVLVLADVPAADLALDQMAALESFVTERGGGLLLAGGRQSYAQGGWQGTGLERLSPLALVPPPRTASDPIALLILIDRSASMGGGDSRSRLTKLDLAREAAILAAEVLDDGDRLAVLAYDDSARWLLPFGVFGGGLDLAGVETAIGGLATGGGTRILAALEAGLPVLAARDVDTRHAILLSDGRDSAEDAAPQEAAVAAAAAAGVTLSTIAIGLDADDAVLARLARVGRGRHHVARDATDLPRLAVEESEIVRARSEQTGAFAVRAAAGGSDRFVRRVQPADLPELGGYLALTPRDGAAVALVVGPDDPLLATWRYGLGEVAGWTSDTGERWAEGWRAGEGAAFWDGLVRAIARAPAHEGLEVTLSDRGDAAIVTVTALAEDGTPLDLAEGRASITGTRGVASAALEQVAPSRYRAVVPWPADAPDALAGAVLLARGSTRRTAAFVARRGQAPEWRIGRPGADVLAAIAHEGGGAVLSQDEVLGRIAAERDEVALWPWLLGLAVVLWPLDVYLGLGRQRGVRLDHGRNA